MSLDPAAWVLYADEALLAINKPAGLPTLVDGWKPDALYLVGALRAIYSPLWTVHRLDRDTSGVIVFARSAAAHARLNSQFEMRRVSKRYLALVRGEPEWETTTIILPLRADADRRHRTLVDHRRGKPARTELRVLRRFGGRSLLEAAPLTGRTHQVRVHLAAVGLPILGDALYTPGAATETDSPLRRTALHAVSLRLEHPGDGRKMFFEAPIPEDFRKLMDSWIETPD